MHSTTFAGLVAQLSEKEKAIAEIVAFLCGEEPVVDRLQARARVREILEEVRA